MKRNRSELEKSMKITNFGIDLPEAPTFYPTVEEFEDPLKYLESLYPKAEKYGLFKVVPPEEVVIKSNLNKRDFKFQTKIQNIHQLQERNNFDPTKEISPSRSSSVESSGRKKRKLETGGKCAWTKSDEVSFGYEMNESEFSLYTFSKIANEFEENYKFEMKRKSKTSKENLPNPIRRRLARKGGLRRINGVNYLKKKEEPSLKDVEMEYWDIVTKGTKETRVFYGSDLDILSHHSGFSKNWNSGWNLNNLPIVDDSLLKYLYQKIPGITSPMMYVGMLFSSFCWHTEDNYLFSTNYIHFGAPKTWYAIPASAAVKFETLMKQKLPHLFEYQPNLLHSLVTMFSPSICHENNIPIYTLTHNEGEYIFTCPQSYHAGFNQGFNCAESVNLVLPNWLPYGRNATEDYFNIHRPSAFSHEQLNYNALLDYKNLDSEVAQMIKVNFKSLIKKEKLSLKKLIEEKGIKNQEKVELKKRESFSTRKTKPQKENRLCSHCHQDCFFSYVGCKCKSEFVCLSHSDNLCDCKNESKTIFIRHSIDHLEGILNSCK
eukprot:gene207-4453_t